MTTTDRRRGGVAIAFHCEHSPTRSRVFALVAVAGRRPSLHAVLTCNDPIIAELAASALSDAASGGRGRHVNDFIERVSQQLPDAPAASFRQAVNNVRASTWVSDEARSVAYDALRDGYGYEQCDDLPVTPLGRDGAARTGDQPRLADLPGPVVQVLSYLEVHVHDIECLLAAAGAQGWSPDDELDGDSPDAALDAVMYLADGAVNDPPGTDFLSAGSEGQLLDRSRGDEVSDWSTEELIANFGTGWRIGDRTIRMTDQEKPPDFAVLYADNHPISPRIAAQLWAAADLIADPDGLTPLEERLPPIAQRQGPEFVEWMRDVVRALRDRLAAPAGPGTIENMAEQVALAAIIDEAESVADLIRDDPELWPWITELPADGTTLNDIPDILLRDVNHELLHNPALDGIENDEEWAAKVRAPNLHPRRWFEPFYAI